MEELDKDLSSIQKRKYDYLKSPCLIEDFKNNYLASLNIFLNDEKFQEKAESLPLLKSSAITKYEKIIAKKESEKQKLLNKNIKINFAVTNKTSTKSNKNYSVTEPEKKIIKKPVQMRYIIIDNELIHLTLETLEENNEINNKITDPFNSYFHEKNTKIRKKALNQLISNIFPKSIDISENMKESPNNTETQTNILPKISLHKKSFSNDYDNYFLENEMEYLDKKYSFMNENNNKNQDNSSQLMKIFKENCNLNNIITLEQKIDYYVYLFQNNYLNGKINNNDKISKSVKALKKTGKSKKESSSFIKNPAAYRRPSLVSLDTSKLYLFELKSNFKIPEENLLNNSNLLETYERDLGNKIKSFQLVKKNFETSTKLVDKLRMYLRCFEVSKDKLILRNCDINSERFLYLILKKYFDFSNLKHLNMSKNNLGDIGGAYLLTLIKRFSNEIDHLNISYNFLGKTTNDILINILSKNDIKINSLAIGGNKLGDKLFSELSIGISANNFLTKLFVNDNDLGKMSSVIFGSILKYDKKLKLIDVSKNDFGDENISYMMKGLICNSTLEILFLNDMNLTNKSFRIFETTLCINTTLKQLFLERNKLTHNGWKLLSNILNSNKYIEYISLVGNKFEPEHINLIMENQRLVKLRVISKTDYFIQITSLNEKVNLYEYLE